MMSKLPAGPWWKRTINVLGPGGCGLSGKHPLAQSYQASRTALSSISTRSRNGHEITATAVILVARKVRLRETWSPASGCPAGPGLLPGHGFCSMWPLNLLLKSAQDHGSLCRKLCRMQLRLSGLKSILTLILPPCTAMWPRG